MFKDTQYYGIIKKAVIAFGTLFNEVQLVRPDPKTGKAVRTVVPLDYGPKQKYLVRQTQDPNLGIEDKQVAIQLPRMAFQMTSVGYDSRRKLVSTEKIVKQVNPTTRKKILNPVPYSLDFELYIIAKNQDDAHQIIERILPYFTPKLTVTITSVSDLELTDDLDVTLTGAPFEDPWEGSIAERRDIIWTLKFNMAVNFYGRILDQKIIKKVQVDLLVPRGEEITPESIANTPRSARIVTTPNPPDANPTDDFGYSTSIYEYDDGMKYNPETGQDEQVEDE